MRNQSVYIGPPYKGLIPYQVFSNGIPDSVYKLLQEVGPVQRLLVPVHLLPETQRRSQTLGTEEHRAYEQLMNGDISNEGVMHVMSSSYFDTPVPSKQYNSAGQIVNPADGIDSDGAQLVRIVDGSAGGSQPEDVTLQNNATAAGNGREFAPTDANYTLTFEITGTSTSRTIAFELAGPSGVYGPHTAFNVTDPTKFGAQTTGGSNTAPESWEVSVPAGYKFRTRVTAVAGGNVTITGKAVK